MSKKQVHTEDPWDREARNRAFREGNIQDGTTGKGSRKNERKSEFRSEGIRGEETNEESEGEPIQDPEEEGGVEEEGMIEGAGERNPVKGRAGKPRWKPGHVTARLIMKNIRFFLFLAVLAVIYIYNGHYADKIVRDINRTNQELKEMQYEYKTLKSEVMFRSKQSELAKAVEPFGLKVLTSPPYLLLDTVSEGK
jgi:hypothetical protein